MPSPASSPNGLSSAGSTFMPIVTKKTGPSRSATGLTRSSMCARRSVVARTSPAATPR